MHMLTLSRPIDFLKHFACQCMAVFCGTYSPIMLIYFTPLGGNVSDDYMDFRAGHITTCWALSATISQLKVRYMYGFKNSFVTICYVKIHVCSYLLDCRLKAANLMLEKVLITYALNIVLTSLILLA